MSTRADHNTIVVGVDDSPTALNAARWAAYLAGALHTPLLIATAPPHAQTAAQQLADRAHQPQWYDSARETVARTVELVRTCAPELTVGTVLPPGPPARALVELSAHARIVVVGAQTAYGARLLGHVTMRVAQHAHCPVGVWRGANGRPISRDKPVAVGIDGTELSIPAIAHGFEIAATLGVPLTAVHCWPSRITEVGHRLDRGEQERTLLAESLAGWRTDYPDVEVIELPVPGLARSVLDQLADEVQLLVVGSHGHPTATALLFGSTSRDLLHHTACPVLVCRS
ncbi:universal stress protein [Nocardia vinacea]|uniref:universal stress protein n=1 Tax=Nocardia vinacea TaxID=96468 RepID=UPI0002FCDDBB|nr:universal stress protein [Nocardia vinacea]